MTDDELRQLLANQLTSDPRTRGFVGIRAVTDALLPAVRAYADQNAADVLDAAADNLATLPGPQPSDRLRALAANLRSRRPAQDHQR
jgi:hypothetical protein